ncbi:MAG: hypothetical protein IPM94_11460 [bacterium]|nr:hypothetical protein [bacterium]
MLEKFFYLITDDLNTIAVDSQQMFYLQPQDEMQQDGSTTQHFYLIGQQDLESVHAGNEAMSWGGVKAL